MTMIRKFSPEYDAILDITIDIYDNPTRVTPERIEQVMGPSFAEGSLDDMRGELSESSLIALAVVCDLAYEWGIHPDGARRCKRSLWLTREQRETVAVERRRVVSKVSQ